MAKQKPYVVPQRSTLVHLRTEKLFTAGGIELKREKRKNETYTCCTMIIIDDEFKTTDDLEVATCKSCLKRTSNQY